MSHHSTRAGVPADDASHTRGIMNFRQTYREGIVSAVESIDLEKVAKVIELFQDARAQNRNIFVAGSRCSSAAASRVLCDMVSSSSFNRLTRFRIMPLNDRAPKLGSQTDHSNSDRIFIEQLKNLAEPGDVVVGISSSCDSPIARALSHCRIYRRRLRRYGRPRRYQRLRRGCSHPYR